MFSASFAKHFKSQHTFFILLGILLIATNLRAPFTGVPPLLPYIQAEFGLSTLASGVLTTLPLLAFAVVSPFGARFAQRWGLEQLLALALLTVLIGILLRSTLALGGLYLGTLLIGMGIAIGNVLLPSLVKRDFPRRIPTITGAYFLTMGIAAALGSAAAVPLASVWNWQGALWSFALLPIVSLIVWWMPLKSAAHATTPSTATPIPPPASTTPLLRSPLAWQVTLFLGLNSLIYYTIIGWLPSILIATGMSAAQAGSMHGILQLATAVPGLVAGPILNRLKDQRAAAVIVALCSALALAGFWWWPSWSLVWAIVFGIGTGASIIIGLSLVALRTSNVAQATALSGMAQSIGYLLAAAGPLFMGALYDLLHSWFLPLMLCLVLALIIALLGALAGRNKYIE